MVQKEDFKKRGEIYHPECHDAGKLLYTPNERGEDRHWNFIDEMDKPWQQVIKQHHFVREDDIIFLPVDQYVFLSIVADHLAAGMLRNEGRGEANYIVNKLWNRKDWDFENYRTAGSAQEKIVREVRKIGIEELKEEMVKFFKSEPKDFLERYRDLLVRRAEDAHGRTNIISLYMHSLITKKFYNILLEAIEENSCDVRVTMDKVREVLESRFELDKNEVKQRLEDLERELVNKVKVNVLGVEILIPHYIFRAHDLNFYSQLINRIEGIKGKYDDNFFFFFGLKFVIICNNQIYEDIKEELKEVAREFKVHVLVRWRSLQLNQVKDIFVKLFDESEASYSKNLLVNLPGEIAGHLCEVCMMDKGDVYIEDDKVSYLCSRCKEVREEGKRSNPFRKYASWESGYVCAVNFKYLFNEMKGWIDNLYNDYLRAQGYSDGETSIKNHLPLVEEFLDDFKSAIESVVKRSEEDFGEGDVEVIFNDLFLVHIETKGQIWKLFKIIGDVVNDKLSSLGCSDLSPVKIYLSLGSVKYPFFMHYSRFREDFSGDIAILIEDEKPVYLSFKQFFRFLKWSDSILKENFAIRSARIHQMLEIARVSEVLARLKQASDQEEDRGLRYSEMLEDVGYAGMMTLLKIVDRYCKDKEGRK